MSLDTPFTAETAASVTRARQHSVGDLLRRTALRYPDKLAVIDGERRATFADFDAAANRVANVLTARGLAKGDRLALLSHNCWQYVVLAFATAKIGVVLVQRQLHAGRGGDRLHPRPLGRVRTGHGGRPGWDR